MSTMPRKTENMCREVAIRPIPPITEFEAMELGTHGLSFVRLDRRMIRVLVADSGELRDEIDIRDFTYSARPGGDDFATAVEGYLHLNGGA